ncbi:MAG: hypothetical protein AAFP18_07480 [Bacteroidota bacterium]
MRRIAPPNETVSGSDLLAKIVADVASGETSDAEKAEAELFKLVLEDPELSKILHNYGAGESHLREIYQRLNRYGAGQWVKGAFVSAASIATIPTLKHILSELSDFNSGKHRLDENNFWMKLSYDLIMFFES